MHTHLMTDVDQEKADAIKNAILDLCLQQKVNALVALSATRCASECFEEIIREQGGEVFTVAAPSPSVREAAEAVDRWTRKAYPFGSGMTEQARLSKLMKILSCHMPASLAGDRDLISRSALLEELKNGHATCIKNAEQDGRESVRVMMEHFAEAGRQGNRAHRKLSCRIRRWR